MTVDFHQRIKMIVQITKNLDRCLVISGLGSNIETSEIQEQSYLL